MLVRISLTIGLAVGVYAQPAGPAGATQNPRGRNPGSMIPPLEETGFQSIFDGKTLTGWDGDPQFWRVENGALVGETTTDKQPKQNTFLIWRGGSPANFELKLHYRLTGFTSGIRYRSTELPDIKWAMKGYQADMDGEQRYTGQVYEERARGFVALRAQFPYPASAKKPALAAYPP